MTIGHKYHHLTLSLNNYFWGKSIPDFSLWGVDID